MIQIDVGTFVGVIIVALFAGAMLGLFVAALCAAARDEEG